MAVESTPASARLLRRIAPRNDSQNSSLRAKGSNLVPGS
jgi:hypothetical protein